jgi:hypothetical protein
MRELEEQLGLEAALEIQSMDAHYVEQSQSRVILPGGDIKISSTAEAIARAIAPAERVFSRDGSVWYVREDEDGVCKLHPVHAAKARSLFEDYCEFLKKKTLKDGTIKSTPEVMSETIAKAILESEAFINGLFEITGISKVPFPVVGDGGDFRLVEKGYDEETKTLVCGNSNSIHCNMPVEEAVSMIRTLYADTKFMTESDEARCISNLLTPAFRRAGLVGKRIPMEVSEADKSQSGKTFLQQIKAAVYGDLPVYVNERKNGVGSTDESFSAALLSGRPFVLLDNFRGKINLTSLESFLTADGKFDCRALRSRGSVDPENYFLGLTSNGVEMTKDLANRSCFVRIRKRPEGYEFRDYEDKEFIDFLKSNHEIFLSAIYSILRHWNEEGQHKTEEKRHSFRPWARVMDYIVQNYFGLPPLLDGHDEASQRTVSPHLSFLREFLIKLSDEDGFDSRSFRASELAEKCMEEDMPIPGVSEAMQGDRETRNMAMGKILQNIMGDQNEFQLDEFQVKKESVSGIQGGSGAAKEHWEYRFSRT